MKTLNALSFACFEAETINSAFSTLLVLLVLKKLCSRAVICLYFSLSFACFEEAKDVAILELPLSFACFEGAFRQSVIWEELLVLLVLKLVYTNAPTSETNS